MTTVAIAGEEFAFLVRALVSGSADCALYESQPYPEHKKTCTFLVIFLQCYYILGDKQPQLIEKYTTTNAGIDESNVIKPLT